MTYDVARVRGLIPSLGDGWIHLDPQAGMLVPDVVSRAVSTGFRTASFSHLGRNNAARRSAAILDAAREAVADLVGGDPAGVVLGPDRAVLLAWLAESLSSRLGLGTGIVLSRLDDEANVAPWLRIANRYGAHVRWAEVEIETCEMPSWQFEELIGPTARLVALTAASPIVGSAPAVRVAGRARGGGGGGGGGGGRGGPPAGGGPPDPLCLRCQPWPAHPLSLRCQLCPACPLCLRCPRYP
ncbi:aminotransferase class V-fold PLP-dependent enzyme, partial [Nocardia farcinica]|uniref:aminotransferase class V-fold PLP-dependent enzyme n=1 Tax=Nocardia farcinica TaxID=37329 RepID=UPI002453F998